MAHEMGTPQAMNQNKPHFLGSCPALQVIVVSKTKEISRNILSADCAAKLLFSLPSIESIWKLICWALNEKGIIRKSIKQTELSKWSGNRMQINKLKMDNGDSKLICETALLCGMTHEGRRNRAVLLSPMQLIGFS